MFWKCNLYQRPENALLTLACYRVSAPKKFDFADEGGSDCKRRCLPGEEQAALSRVLKRR